MIYLATTTHRESGRTSVYITQDKEKAESTTKLMNGGNTFVAQEPIEVVSIEID